MQPLAQVNEELTGKLEQNLVPFELQSTMVKSRTILVGENWRGSVEGGVGPHKWYQNLYIVDVLIKTSNLLELVDYNDFGKVDQRANEINRISNLTFIRYRGENF